MARALLTPQKIVDSGLTVNDTEPPADGDTFVPAGGLALYVSNEDVADITVTIPTPATYEGKAIADAGGPVPAGTWRLFGPFPRALFGQPIGDPDAGRVHVNYSAVANVTRALISL